MKTKKDMELKIAKFHVREEIKKINEFIKDMGTHAKDLYETLYEMNSLIDNIRNIPIDTKTKYKESNQMRLNWKSQAEQIEKEYEKVNKKDAAARIAGMGVGVGAGVATVVMGPSLAMGVATTFGAASTGAAIGTLHGVVATNAALAWLGGGALAAGGGGVAAGQALIALAGPIGIGISLFSFATGFLFFLKSNADKKDLQNVLIAISERDINTYKLAGIELQGRTFKLIDENQKLKEAIEEIKTFGLNYDEISEENQYKLGTYVNWSSSATQLLIEPIVNLLPKFTEEDFEEFLLFRDKKDDICQKHKKIITLLAKLFYGIELSDRKKGLFIKSLRNNKEILESMEINKKDLKINLMDTAYEAINFKKQKLT